MPEKHGSITMELRHLRYFIAVAEEGSLTNAAERRLHTAQPSLSRQIRDLEMEIGVKLLERRARGIVLTPAGRIFLDHARLVLMQIDTACEAARGTEQPDKQGFVIGFLPGQEVIWLSESLRILREEAPDVEVTLTTRSSPELADALMQGKIDVALLRRETRTAGLAFKSPRGRAGRSDASAKGLTRRREAPSSQSFRLTATGASSPNQRIRLPHKYW
jgi:LysR family transcriptional regulator, hca operon transcriptional activator